MKSYNNQNLADDPLNLLELHQDNLFENFHEMINKFPHSDNFENENENEIAFKNDIYEKNKIYICSPPIDHDLVFFQEISENIERLNRIEEKSKIIIYFISIF